MADMDAARLQLLMQPDRPQSQTIERVNKVLREAITERERTTQAFNRMSLITQVNVEQTMTELEGYGIKEKSLAEEFRKLKMETGGAVAPEPSQEPVERADFPEVPRTEPSPNLPPRKEKQEEKA